MSYKVFTTKDTGFYADTVEWCPLDPYQDVLACGTYQLIDKDDLQDKFAGRRVGKVIFYRLNCSQSNLVEVCSTQIDAGILDMKWYPSIIKERLVLGAVSAESQLKIYTFTEKEGLDNLSENTVNIGDNKICLSLDWSSTCHSSTPKCLVSDSQGQLTLLQCPEASWEPCQIQQWTGHEYEAWITAFNQWTPSVVYSGGDDCKLKGWDTRTDCTLPIFTSRKHDMGVSSIQCNPVYEHIMATGSYDEKILIWDTRNMKAPLCMSRPGGGVWRIKWHPSRGDYILTASMYEGFHVLHYDSSQLDLLVSFKENYELAYGADWSRQERQTTKHQTGKEKDTLDDTRISPLSSLVATCSFYDHILHLWEVSC